MHPITVVQSEIDQIASLADVHGGRLGINYLVRHPQPTLACYTGDRQQDKTRGLEQCYTELGRAEVARFAAHVVEVVRRVEPPGGVGLHYTRLYRTELFARTVAAAVRAGTDAQVDEPTLLTELYADSAAEMIALAEAGDARFVPFVAPIRAEQAKGITMTREQLSLIRAWFPVWVRHAPGARACADALEPYLTHVAPGRIRLLFTHEHVIAAYLHAHAPPDSPFSDAGRCFLGTSAYVCVLGNGACLVVDRSANSEVPGA